MYKRYYVLKICAFLIFFEQLWYIASIILFFFFTDMDQSASTKNEIIIVGSSRVRGLRWKRYPDYSISLTAKSGLSHEELVRLVDEKISDKTVLLILVCLQIELRSRTMSPNGEPGMVFANPTPPIEKNCLQSKHSWPQMEKRSQCTYHLGLALHTQPTASKWDTEKS